jgi:hypothetical protein
MVERRKTIRAALAVDNSKRNKECLRKPKTEQDEGKEREKKRKKAEVKARSIRWIVNSLVGSSNVDETQIWSRKVAVRGGCRLGGRRHGSETKKHRSRSPAGVYRWDGMDRGTPRQQGT